MPIDPSIPLQVKVPQSNPLQTALQAAQFRYMNANGQAMQQKLDANTATSQAYQQATDPNTGVVDNNKLIGILSQDPRAAYNLGQVVQGINTQKQQNLTLQTGEQGLAAKRGAAVAQAGVGLLTNPNATGMDYVNALSDLRKNGIIDDGTFANTISEIAPVFNEPAKLRSLAQGMLAKLPPEIQAQYVAPALSTIDTGGAVNTVATNRMTGQPVVTGALNKTLSPGEATTPTRVFDTASGAPKDITRAQFAAGSSNGAGWQAAPALGQPEIAAAAAGRYNDLTAAAANAPTAINGYDRALAALKNTTSGPGASSAASISGALNSFGIPVASDTTTNFQALKKYLANAGAQAATASGYSGSDARLSTFTEGQPNPDKMNPAALSDAISYVKALQNGVIAKNNAAQAYLQAHGGNTATLPQFETQWSNSFSPDVMELRGMSPQDQQAYISKLTPDKKQALMKSYSAMSAIGAF